MCQARKELVPLFHAFGIAGPEGKLPTFPTLSVAMAAVYPNVKHCNTFWNQIKHYPNVKHCYTFWNQIKQSIAPNHGQFKDLVALVVFM